MPAAGRTHPTRHPARPPHQAAPPRLRLGSAARRATLTAATLTDVADALHIPRPPRRQERPPLTSLTRSAALDITHEPERLPVEHEHLVVGPFRAGGVPQ